jgi:amino acid permease
MSEIGFVLVGRKSVFILNGIISISSFGLMMIYFIVFGDIAASITKENMDNPNNFICTRAFFVLIISTALLPLILKKEIAHLKLASILLFLAILLFIIIFIVQFITKGNFDNHDLSYKKYYEFKFD